MKQLVFSISFAWSLVLHYSNPFVFYAVEARSNGAGSCPKGKSATSNSVHSIYGLGTGRRGELKPLAERGTTFVLNGIELTPSGEDSQTAEVVMPFGVDLPWILATTDTDYGMRGVLVRVETTESAVFTIVGDDATVTQSSDECVSLNDANVQGVTHTGPTSKSRVTGVIRFDQEADLSLDVTVVYRNGLLPPDNDSITGYSSFVVKIANLDTSSPVSPPSSSSPPTLRPSLTTAPRSTVPEGKLPSLVPASVAPASVAPASVAPVSVAPALTTTSPPTKQPTKTVPSTNAPSPMPLTTLPSVIKQTPLPTATSPTTRSPTKSTPTGMSGKESGKMTNKTMKLMASMGGGGGGKGVPPSTSNMKGMTKKGSGSEGNIGKSKEKGTGSASVERPSKSSNDAMKIENRGNE